MSYSLYEHKKTSKTTIALACITFTKATTPARQKDLGVILLNNKKKEFQCREGITSKPTGIKVLSE